MASVSSITIHRNRPSGQSMRQIRASVMVLPNGGTLGVDEELFYHGFLFVNNSVVDLDKAIGDAALEELSNREEEEFMTEVKSAKNPFPGPARWNARNSLHKRVIRRILRETDPDSPYAAEGHKLLKNIPDARIKTVLGIDDTRLAEIRGHGTRLDNARTARAGFGKVDV